MFIGILSYGGNYYTSNFTAKPYQMRSYYYDLLWN